MKGLQQSANRGGFYCRQTIARSVFVNKKFHFSQPKTPLAQPSPVEGGCSQVATFLKIIDMDINVEKKKRGRKPKANPQKFRYMFRLNDKDHKLFLQMVEKSGKPGYAAFITDCVLNRPLKIIEVNKTAIDFTILLSNFSTQFRAVKNNFNQVYRSLAVNFGEEKALKMIGIITNSTREFGLLQKEIEKITIRFRELCLPK
jgi:hypothetical protein